MTGRGGSAAGASCLSVQGFFLRLLFHVSRGQASIAEEGRHRPREGPGRGRGPAAQAQAGAAPSALLMEAQPAGAFLHLP